VSVFLGRGQIRPQSGHAQHPAAHCLGTALDRARTGPDQGVGIARESAEGELLVLFYHPSPEEAKRRLPEVRADMDKARTMAQ
ncbi:hypothetical protein LJB82_04345, partial [Desulfovibrio sp. OttesenSCG-928-M16]|nr:hypothetical protein [Desulfovibrio sp. OttesenSCG-928-M16]